MKTGRIWKSVGLSILLVALLFFRQRSFTGRVPEDINVILLTVDSLRPDRLGCYGYKRNTSPHIDALAERGVLFRRAFSNSAWTIPCMMSILTSTQPPVHRVDTRGSMLDPQITTIFDSFAEAEYSIPNISFLLSLPEFSGIRVGPVEEHYFSDKDNDEIFRWLDENHQSKFFLFYHYRGVHLPYRPKDESHSVFLSEHVDESLLSDGVKAVLSDAATVFIDTVKFQQSDRPIVEDLYDGEIIELDSFIGRLQARLQKYGLLEKTLLVITADHGEELFDHGFIGHASTARSANIYDEVIRIPLIVSLPGYLPGGVQVREQVQQIDVMPTLLEIAGIPIPASAQGRSLAPLIFEASRRSESSIPVFAETIYGGLQATEEMAKTRVRCVRTDSWKLIETEGPEGKSYQLFDLLIDIKEHQNIYEDNKDSASILQTLLEEWKRENSVRRSALTAKTTAILSRNGEIICPQVIFPYDGVVLDFSQRHGIIRASWTGGPTSTYIIEYEVGTGPHHLTGSFLTFGNQRDFGPYSQELWQALAVRNPWRVRISPDTRPRCWSDWLEFNFQ
jgi:choline-sulfatase